MTSRQRILAAVVVIFGVVGYLMVTAFGSTSTYYYTVDEYIGGEVPRTERVRVSGDIVAGSVDWDPTAPSLAFAIEGEQETMAVVYDGVKPDTFQAGIQAVARGSYDAEAGRFHAESLMIKCPSKYEAAPGEED